MSDTRRRIRAITFDFWRTLYGVHALREERSEKRAEILADTLRISRTDARDAMDHTMRRFLDVHVAEQRTLTATDAPPMLAEYLQVSIPDDTAAQLADRFAAVILEYPPQPIDQALDAVRLAAERVPVGLISDTGVSPGASLEALLERDGFHTHFRSLSFSDAVGVAKPQRRMFEHAAASLGVQPAELIHIGDLEPTDVRGALDFGARALLFGGDNPRYVENTAAEAVFTSWPDFIDRLADFTGDQGRAPVT